MIIYFSKGRTFRVQNSSLNREEVPNNLFIQITAHPIIPTLSVWKYSTSPDYQLALLHLEGRSVLLVSGCSSLDFVR